MTKEQSILAIPEDEPERLFSSPDNIQVEFRALAKQLHPDGGAGDKAMAHLNALHERAKQKVKDGTWETPGLLELRAADGEAKSIHYGRRHKFELGTMYYGSNLVTFALRNEFADLYRNAIRMIERRRFPRKEMELEIARYLPFIRHQFETADDRCVLAIDKTDDVFLLRDVVEALGGKVPPRHVAWMLNATYNIACYLQHVGMTHNAISPDTLFVSPTNHSILLYGGWWYAAPEGARLNALPRHAHALVSHRDGARVTADAALDLSLIRALGRELLGDRTGMTLTRDPDVPDPMARFLRQPTSGVALRDYAAWSKTILPECFGARRFVDLSISESDIYKDRRI